MARWKKIPEYKKFYKVSNKGKVKSLRSGNLLKIRIQNGYPVVGLIDKHGNIKQKYVHSLMALAFLEKPQSNQLLVVDHINGNREDNHLENLRWITQSENVKHAYGTNPKMIGKCSPVLKLDKKKNIVTKYNSMKEACEDTGISRDTLFRILNKKDNFYGGFYYEYATKKKQIILEKDENFINMGIYRDLDFSMFEISNYGRLKSLKFNIIRKTTLHNGYHALPLASKSGKTLTLLIHILVANYFVEKPEDFDKKKYVVNHLDEIKTNNHHQNLEWVTRRDNTIHSRGKPVLQVDIKTGKVLKKFKSIADAYNFLGIKIGNSIGKCCNGRAGFNTAYGFKWRFAN